MTRSPAAEAWRRFSDNRAATAGLVIVGALAAFAVLGPLLTSWAPNASDFTLTRNQAGAPPGPSAAHWLGTDPIFRDLLSRLAHGARISLAVAILSTALATIVGGAIGLASGWLAGTRLGAIDTVAMRVVDVFLALPFLILVTAIGAAVGRTDVGAMILVLGFTSWMAAARLVRARTLEVRERDFVTAARALGARPLRIVLRHVLPDALGPLLVVATTMVGQMILVEAVLEYLTVGVQPPQATWGRMLHEAEPYLGSRLGLVAAPAIAILLGVLGFSRVGDGLRDALEPADGAARRRSFPFDLAVAAAALVLVAAVSPSDPHPPRLAPAVKLEEGRGGTFHVASYLNLRTLDPALAADEVSTSIENLVFARLVAWNRAGVIEPELAREVHASPDGRTYTFELAPHVVFQDGAVLGAADVKRSLERLLAKGTPSPGASHFAGITGFAAYHAGKASELAGVRVVGDRTVAIDLDASDPTFLARMALPFAAPVCPSMGRAVDAHSQALPCGAGPYRLVAWDPDRGIELVRHEAFFDAKQARLERIVWSTNVRPQTQRFLFEDGALDYARDFTATDAAVFRNDRRWRGQVAWSPKLATTALFMNAEVPPFDRPLVRRAVARALDPSVLERMRPDVVAVDRILPASLDAGNPAGSLRRHDLAEALALMKEAGLAFDPTTGAGGWPEEIEYVAVPDTWDQQVGEIWQQQLARIGIRVRLRLVAYAAFLAETARRRKVAMGTTGWNADFADASNFFEPTLSSEAIADEGSQNVAFFSNAAFDAELQRGRATSDRAARRAVYARLEAMVAEEAPWVPTYTVRAFEVWQPYVRGYAPNPLLPEDFRGVFLARDADEATALLGSPLGRRRRH